MQEAQYDVLGIGNAIVDVLAKADDAFLAARGLDKGAMRLIDAAEAEALYAEMGPGVEVSGGSVGNTMAGLASLGGRGAYIGKIAGDELGQVFGHDIRAAGVHFATPASSTGTPTARCLILVTPDAQRTMNTFLGACVELGPEDIDRDLVEASQIVYLEGYLWDPPAAKEAFLKAAQIAHGAGRKVALSLSDSFCVARHRESFRHLVEHHVDVLFANEQEILSLYEVSEFEEAARLVNGHCEVAALTRSEKGALILSGHERVAVPAAHAPQVVDTTGAGDLFAAGFLHGLTRKQPLAACGRMGAIAAAEIIAHFGARPEADLRALIADGRR
jgi:sugar/nucleoside kinase (ribokinase family)